ncbi:MAG: thiolase family protein [Chloroflexi bacterium]|nr:thiolase family protein [Chloroflexota bacterium]
MTKAAVAGVGMLPFGRHRDRTLSDLGVEAVLAALSDAGLAWRDVQLMYCGVVGGGMTPGTGIGAQLGQTGLPIINIDNASASGSSAFREASLAVASGRVDVAAAIGVGKLSQSFGGGSARPGSPEAREGNIRRMQGVMPPAGYFAMRTRRRMHDFGSTIEQFALVSVKNHKHASHNPFAQLQNELTVEEIAHARMIADPLTVPHCCPMGDGAAAAVVVSEERARQLGVRPLITVEASAFRSGIYENGPPSEAETTHLTAQEAYAQAGLGPDDIDLVQVHDAFTVEEIEYCEQLGFCEVGEGERMVENGDTAIGGRIPFSTDGGLLARGHPLGPTGLAQVWETVQQLRGLSGPRQVAGARVGLVHMVGVGGVCIVHILKRP